jgi:hypothetical protein
LLILICREGVAHQLDPIAGRRSYDELERGSPGIGSFEHIGATLPKGALNLLDYLAAPNNSISLHSDSKR